MSELQNNNPDNNNVEYIGFWARVAAPMIGFSLLMSFIPYAVLIVIKILYYAGLSKINIYSASEIYDIMSQILEEYTHQHNNDYSLFIFFLTYYAAYILYLSYMESSPSQASLGKRMIGAIVVDKNGGRISFPKALLRNILKLVSIFSIIGVLLIGLTKKKRGLHDMICGTYVIRSGK